MMPEQDRVIVGIDLGGSGSRMKAVSLSSGATLMTAEAGAAAANTRAEAPERVLAELAGRLTDRIGEHRVEAVAAGIAGLATLAPDPDRIRVALGRSFEAAAATVVADVVAAHMGALRGQPGAVLAAGTGAIALGTDLSRVWRRSDGLGHLIGDLGSGAWIGMEALRIAAADLDGRGERDSALARAAVSRFGSVEMWPAQFYPHPDRARILGSFVPEVVSASARGDAASTTLLDEAAAHLARTLVAALDGLSRRVALTGGLLGEPRLREPLVARLRERVPGVAVEESGGTALDGAVRLASRAAAGDPIGPRAPYVF